MALYWCKILSEKKEKSFEEDFLTTLLGKYAERIVNFHKFLREVVIIISSKEYNNIEFTLLSKSLNYFFQNIDKSQFSISYLPKFLNDKYFNLKSAKLLIDLIKNYPKGDKANQDLEKKTIENAFILWSDANFVKKASSLHLKCTT